MLFGVTLELPVAYKIVLEDSGCGFLIDSGESLTDGLFCGLDFGEVLLDALELAIDGMVLSITAVYP